MNALVRLFAIATWLAGALFVALSLGEEMLVAQLPIVYAILGVGGMLYGMVLYALETSKSQMDTLQAILKDIRDSQK